MQFSTEIILTRNYSLYYSIIEHKKQHLSMPNLCRTNVSVIRAGARTLMGGGGGCIFIYIGLFLLKSTSIQKKLVGSDPEYMNIHPPPQLAF